MLDLTVYSLFLDAGMERHDIPGLLVTAAPRKAARMRAQDYLLLYMRLSHNPAAGQAGQLLTVAQQQEMLHRLAETYFTVPGSVTAGLRAVTARLNDFLLNRNLKAAQAGQTIGLLNLAAVHKGYLFVAHGGATHSFMLGREQVQHFDDSAAARSPSGRGLGLSKQVVPRFYQSVINPGDLLLACAEPPASWTTRSLANSPQLSFDHLRRRLLSDTNGELEAVVVRFQTGKGLIHHWKPAEGGQARPGRTATAPAARPAAPTVTPVPEPPAAAPVEVVTGGLPAVNEAVEASQEVVEDNRAAVEAEQAAAADNTEAFEETSAVVEDDLAVEADVSFAAAQETAEPPPGVLLNKAYDAPPADAPPLPRPPVRENAPVERGLPRIEPDMTAEIARPHARPAKPAARTPEPAARTAARQPAPRRAPKPPAQPKPRDDSFRLAVAAGVRRLGEWRAKAAAPFQKAAGALPKRRDELGREQPFFNIPASVMVAVAIIVPLLVTTVALVVYDRIGRAGMFETMLAQAQANADIASQQSDPVIRRESWAAVYAQVSAIERDYGRNEESAALRQQAMGILDELEGYVRLNYQPVFSGGFPSGVRITRMAATFSDVYLLDSSQGRIYRLYRTGTGYELDATFTCGSGQAGAAIVGPLVDIATLPPNNEMKSSVMGVDTSGNLVYCSPNVTGFSSRPLALPDNGWGAITAMYLYNDTLYVLDPKSNGVYYYDGGGGVFEQRPHMYFDADIPQLNNVIDIAVDQEFLYLLHDDGRMTLCTAGGFTTTKCTEPSPYGDSRPGYEQAPLAFAGSRFTQIVTTQPPDPSLYALDEANQSIYHLSLRRLNLQRQYRPQPVTDWPLPNGSPTAFAIAPNRWALLAFDNFVYFSPIP